MGYFLGKIIDEWQKKMAGWEIPEVTGGLVRWASHRTK